MVLMLQLLCFMRFTALISQGVSILLIVVVIFVLNGIHCSNGWNTVQVLIKHFASCRVFGYTGHHQEAFISNGFQNWKSALEKFHAHQSSIAHKSAILTWEADQQAQRNPERNVVNLINEQQKK